MTSFPNQDKGPAQTANEGNADVILEACNLVKSFSGFRAVDQVSLQVRRGEIHALIGPNGAGKTTLFNLLTKFLPPTSGSIFFNGDEITKLPPTEVARLGLVRSFQISAIFPHLTVMANVRIALQRSRGGSFDFWRSRRLLDSYDEPALALLEKFDLARYASQFAGALPYGRKRALELATTIALSPTMMLLDEPMAGLAQEDIALISALIKTAAAGRTVLMVEHNLTVVESISDRISVLSRGAVLAEGTYATIAANKDVQQAYLGVVDA
jgi:branched-chain amino acid transport system ATP-binding protein